MDTQLHGLGVALVTPFQIDNSIDYQAAKHLVDYQLSGGVDFFVLLGTTGEAPTLSLEEQDRYVRTLVEHIAGRVPVVVGCSGNNTEAVCQRLQAMDVQGVDYILSAVPSYNKPSQQGIFAHFERVAEAAQCPVILYNVPGRTGTNMTADTTCELACKVHNIVGVKEASGSLDQVAHILAGRPQSFRVFSGDDSLTLPMMALGAEGVVSVIGNVLPTEFARLVHAAEHEQYREAAAIHARLLTLYKLLFAEGNPAGIKSALAAKKLIHNVLRLPLVPVSQQLQESLANEIARF